MCARGWLRQILRSNQWQMFYSENIWKIMWEFCFFLTFKKFKISPRWILEKDVEREQSFKEKMWPKSTTTTTTTTVTMGTTTVEIPMLNVTLVSNMTNSTSFNMTTATTITTTPKSKVVSTTTQVKRNRFLSIFG